MVALCFNAYSVYGSSQVKTSVLVNARRKNARLVVRDRGIDRGKMLQKRLPEINRELSSRLRAAVFTTTFE
jgi:hypothetical protein